MLGLCHLFFSGKITVGHCVGKVPDRIWNRMHSKTVVLAANNLLTSALQIFITGLKVIITLTKKKKKRQEMKASKQTKPRAKSKQKATKLNKGRNSRNSHGKTEFLESDEFYPFLVVT